MLDLCKLGCIIVLSGKYLCKAGNEAHFKSAIFNESIKTKAYNLDHFIYEAHLIDQVANQGYLTVLQSTTNFIAIDFENIRKCEASLSEFSRIVDDGNFDQTIIRTPEEFGDYIDVQSPSMLSYSLVATDASWAPPNATWKALEWPCVTLRRTLKPSSISHWRFAQIVQDTSPDPEVHGQTPSTNENVTNASKIEAVERRPWIEFGLGAPGGLDATLIKGNGQFLRFTNDETKGIHADPVNFLTLKEGKWGAEQPYDFYVDMMITCGLKNEIRVDVWFTDVYQGAIGWNLNGDVTYEDYWPALLPQIIENPNPGSLVIFIEYEQLLNESIVDGNIW